MINLFLWLINIVVFIFGCIFLYLYLKYKSTAALFLCMLLYTIGTGGVLSLLNDKE